TMSIGDSNNKTMGKRAGKRPGRKPSKIDERAKLERSRQSARECRARKKLRYQYLEELVSNREKAVFALRDELELYKQWCIQLENGGPVPEALLKMIASEEVAIKRRQMAQVTRSLLRQQQQNCQFASSSSSSTSPDLSSVSSQREYPQPRHVNLVQPQTISDVSVHESQSHQAVPDHLPPQRHQQLHLEQLLMYDQTSDISKLQKQFAFDHSKLQEHQPKGTAPTLNHLLPAPLSQELMQDVIFQRSLCSKQQQQHTFLPPNENQQPNATLPSHGAYTSSSNDNTPRAVMSSKCQESVLPRVNSEPHMKHGHSFDVSRISSDTLMHDAELCSNSELHRKRSHSNPVTMASVSRPNITSADDLPSPLQDFITSHSSSYQSTSQPHLGFGLFSGSVINNKPSFLSFNLPTTVAMEDSSSSEDSINEQHLFQSSMNTQKRKVASPCLPENAKRSFVSPNNVVPKFTNFDPNTGLPNLDDTHGFGLTAASSTPSPLSYGHTSSNATSPSRSPRYNSGLSNSTSSSCATASPTPLSSLSSMLDLSVSSPAISPSTYSLALEISPPLPSATTHQSPGSMNTSLLDPLPDWYSFLADLEDGTPSALTHQQGTSSNVAVTLTSKQHSQLFASNQSFMNVPDIVSEMLNCSDQLL
ncbi:unnamed protein product, partial [Candidula unifasciata]